MTWPDRKHKGYQATNQKAQLSGWKGNYFLNIKTSLPLKRDNPVCLAFLVPLMLICEHKDLMTTAVKEAGSDFHFHRILKNK